MPRQAPLARHEHQYESVKRLTRDERTYEQLYEDAKRRNIQGRSKMSKTELERALGGRR
jgi:hypothetical protein